MLPYLSNMNKNEGSFIPWGTTPLTDGCIIPLSQLIEEFWSGCGMFWQSRGWMAKMLSALLIGGLCGGCPGAGGRSLAGSGSGCWILAGSGRSGGASRWMMPMPWSSSCGIQSSGRWSMWSMR